MELSVQNREIFGKSVKKMREQGLIPAELYGRGLANLHLAVSSKDLNKVFKQAGENAVVSLIIDKERRPVLLHDLQVDPITNEILSIDFYQVRLDEKIKVRVPIEFVGTASAIKDKSGILVKAMQEIEVEALPSDLPQNIQIDLSGLNDIGQSLYVKDLKITGNFKLLINPKTVIVTITAPITEEQEAAVAQEVDVSAVKVETEEKKKEREAAKPAEAVPSAKPAVPEKK